MAAERARVGEERIDRVDGDPGPVACAEAERDRPLAVKGADLDDAAALRRAGELVEQRAFFVGEHAVDRRDRGQVRRPPVAAAQTTAVAVPGRGPAKQLR